MRVLSQKNHCLSCLPRGPIELQTRFSFNLQTRSFHAFSGLSVTVPTAVYLAFSFIWHTLRFVCSQSEFMFAATQECCFFCFIIRAFSAKLGILPCLFRPAPDFSRVFNQKSMRSFTSKWRHLHPPHWLGCFLASAMLLCAYIIDPVGLTFVFSFLFILFSTTIALP